MRRTGAELVVYALEQLGIRHTFGIPGVHNTELYDCLGESKQITPVLVTHEQGAAFMADAIGRSGPRVACVAVVPAAGITHAMSGIGEAFLDGVPMLVISGGVRRDTGRSYQLHQLDQRKLTAAVVKEYYLLERHADIVQTLFTAHDLAVSGEPGPVMVEVPFELLSFAASVESLPRYAGLSPQVTALEFEAAVSLLRGARRPVIFAGWGARRATQQLVKLAELLNAPVSTTLQGLSVFPSDHPLHAGLGFGKPGTPAARAAFDGHDCMLAVGTRFSELATGSYAGEVTKQLIHADINPEVFDKNFPAQVKLCGDASSVLSGLLEALGTAGAPRTSEPELAASIAKNKQAHRQSWRTASKPGRVNPARFFESLRRNAQRESTLVVDDGNHTFLAAEHFPVYASGQFISPTDFNCMGYAVPAACGVKFDRPDSEVLAVVGDGAFLMTGLELLTAVSHELGLPVFVFRDGELGQISQFQSLALGKKTCTELAPYRVEGIATAVGAHYLLLADDEQVDAVVGEALSRSRAGQVVVIEVSVDYGRRSSITQGVARVSFARFSMREKVRFISRSLARRVGQGLRSLTG